MARIRAAFAAGLGLLMRGPAGSPHAKWICRITKDGGKTWSYWG